MPLVVIRHKVKDFATWKAAYDAHAGARAKAGFAAGRVTRSADEPNEVVLIFETPDLAQAKAFCASPDLKAAMQAAGVTDMPNIYFLNDAK
jgi:quinol monooxygenase YgiN